MKRKILSLILSVSLLATLFSVSIVTGAAGNVDYGSKAWENFETMTNEQAVPKAWSWTWVSIRAALPTMAGAG